MKISFRNIFTVLKAAFKEWYAKDPFRESAVIAYYAIFSLPGLLVVIISLAGYFFGRDAVNSNVTSQIKATFGADTAKQIQDMIVKASETGNSIWATVIGVITIIIGATGVFAQFQKSLNTIWEVKADESKSGIWDIIRVRLFSFGLIVSIAFILIVSLVISAMLSAFGNWIASHFSDSFVILLQVVNFILTLIILAIVFALMVKILPDAKIKWRHVWIGSLVTAFLFDIGKFGLGLYFGKANPATGYGAEFTYAYAKMNSGKVAPSEIAKTALPCKPD